MHCTYPCNTSFTKPASKFSWLVEEQDNLTGALQKFSGRKRQGTLRGLFQPLKHHLLYQGNPFSVLPCIFCLLFHSVWLVPLHFLFFSQPQSCHLHSPPSHFSSPHTLISATLCKRPQCSSTQPWPPQFNSLFPL